MRLSLFALLASVMILGALSQAPVFASGSRVDTAGATVSYAQEKPGAKLDVNIDVNKGGGNEGRKWYLSPIWLAIGGLAVLLVLVLFIMAGRGGGTTIVR